MISAKEAREKTRQAVEKQYSDLTLRFQNKLSYVENEINRAAANRKNSATLQVTLLEDDIKDFLKCVERFGYTIAPINFKGDLYSVIKCYEDFASCCFGYVIEFTIIW